jgi:outer membrane biosynthesis protein TonB
MKRSCNQIEAEKQDALTGDDEAVVQSSANQSCRSCLTQSLESLQQSQNMGFYDIDPFGFSEAAADQETAQKPAEAGSQKSKKTEKTKKIDKTNQTKKTKQTKQEKKQIKKNEETKKKQQSQKSKIPRSSSSKMPRPEDVYTEPEDGYTEPEEKPDGYISSSSESSLAMSTFVAAQARIDEMDYQRTLPRDYQFSVTRPILKAKTSSPKSDDSWLSLLELE